MITEKNITLEQIKALQSESFEGNDHLMGVICDIALGNDFNQDDWTVLDENEIRKLVGISQIEAIAMCVSTINSARAMW